MTDQQPPTFKEALDAVKALGEALDAERRTSINREPRPETVAAFHAANLDVCRAIHRAHPNEYADPDATTTSEGPRFWLNDTIDDPRGIGIVDEHAGGVVAYATTADHGAAIVSHLNEVTS